MCGIATVITQDTGPSAVQWVAAMHDDLASRGPDGEGWLLVDSDLRANRLETCPTAGDGPMGSLRVAAAIRRLAVRDPSRRADQPLARRGGQLWILHNGEIFNDADLRRDLAGRGLTFETGNDAETVLAAYEAWGQSCFEHLRGMWATVIVDLAAGQLLFCRDRLGIKPLFYARDGSRTLIASHPRAIARALPHRTSLNERRWGRFLRGYPAIDPDDGFFAGVHVVPAGGLISVDLRDPAQPLKSRRYWSLDAVTADRGASHGGNATRDEFLSLLEASTREQMLGDRTVGCLLSGGLDSSLVASVAARTAKAAGAPPPICFSIVYDDPRMSEWPYIQSVAAHAGTRVVSHRLTPEEAWGLIDPVTAAHGEPLLGQDGIAQYRAFRLARDHGSIVALEGQGSDELFAGMPSYEAVMFAEWFRHGEWGTLWREARGRATPTGKSTLRVALSLALSPTIRRVSSPHYDWVIGEPAPAQSAPWHDAMIERSRDSSLLNRYLFDLTRRTNLPSVLLMQDRMAMAHGVENRPPFLDHRLVEWAFRLPPASKVGGGRRKRIVWEAAQQVLPSIITARTDKKAIVSRNDWMMLRTKFREPLVAMAHSSTLRQAPGVDGSRMTRFVEKYLRGEHDDSNAVWRLYTGWRWLEQFEPRT